MRLGYLNPDDWKDVDNERIIKHYNNLVDICNKQLEASAKTDQLLIKYRELEIIQGELIKDLKSRITLLEAKINIIP